MTEPLHNPANNNTLINHRYRRIKALGEGGFGKTFLAEDTQMPSKRLCVIKQLKPMSSRPEVAQLVRDRFAREAAVLETLGKGHNQLPSLYAYFSQGNQYYLVQEWIEGIPLNAFFQTAWPEGKVRTLLISLLQVLDYIHRNNIIHRDVKPENIILRKSDNLPCLIDFGAVKELMSTVVSPSGTLKSSLAMGTPGYMPPEQISGRPTFSSDLYSLGLTMVFLLTSRSPAELPINSQTGQLLWQQYALNTSDTLTAIITQSINPYAQNRYATARDMLAALTQVPASTALPSTIFPEAALAPTSAPPPLPPTDAPSAPSSFSFKSIAIAASLFVGIGALALGLKTIRQSPFASHSVVQSETTQSKDPTDSKQGRLLVEQPDDNSERVAALEQQVQENPNDTSLQQELAVVYQQQADDLYQRGLDAEALEKIESALSLQPDLAVALALQGDILANQTIQDLPGAIALYTKALTSTPDNADILTKRCKAYASQKKWSLAEADCSQGLDLDADNADLYGRRGDIYFAQANYEAAVQDYGEAIALNTNNGLNAQNQRLYYRRHEALGKLGRFEEATDDLKLFKSLTPLTGDESTP